MIIFVKAAMAFTMSDIYLEVIFFAYYPEGNKNGKISLRKMWARDERFFARPLHQHNMS